MARGPVHARQLLSRYLQHVDPGLQHDASSPQERAKRKLQLRTMLRSLPGANPAYQTILDPDSRIGLARMIIPGETDDASARRRELLTALISDDLDESKQPRVDLLAQTLKILSPPQADQLNEHQRANMIPLKNSSGLVLPGSADAHPDPSTYSTEPRLVIKFPTTKLPGLSISRSGPDAVCFTFGKRGMFETTGLNLYLLNAVFEPPKGGPGPAVTIEPQQPQSLTDVPECVQLRIASFAQSRLRLHVLASAVATDGASRPIAFETMKHYSFRDTTKYRKPHESIKAYVHPSSIACACPTHSRMICDPAQKPQVCLNIDFCGLVTSAEKPCTLHRASGTGCPLVPNVCCASMTMCLTCTHTPVDETGRRKSNAYGSTALRIPLNALTDMERLELSTILATLIEYRNSVEKSLTPAPGLTDEEKQERAEEIAIAVGETEIQLETRINEVERRMILGTRITDADLVARDSLTHSLLVKQFVAYKPHAKSFRLMTCVSHETAAAALAHDGEPRVLTKQAKELVSGPHYRLFPIASDELATAMEQRMISLTRSKRPRSKSGRSSATPSKRSRASATDAQKQGRVYDRFNQPPDRKPVEHGPPKRKDVRGHSGDADGDVFKEYIDVAGLDEMRKQIYVLIEQSLTSDERDRGLYYLRFMDTLRGECGAEIQKHGLRLLPLTINYTSRNDGGRLYAVGKSMPSMADGEARTVSLQGAPKEVRAFACCRLVHDYDIFSCHHVLLLQLSTKLTWPTNRDPPQLTELGSWCADRPSYVKHIAETHSLATDEEKWPDYQKDMAKLLVLRLLYGGAYNAWIRKTLGKSSELEPHSPRVEALSAELYELRAAVFASNEWHGFVEKDRERLKREGQKKTEEDRDRSIFSRIACKLENSILTSMRRFASRNGFRVRTLAFDGYMVEHREDRQLDLEAMRAAILADTTYDVKIVEKPLYSQTFPRLSLKH